MLGKIIKGLNKSIEAFTVGSLMLLVVFVALQVIFRLTGFSAPWTEELARFLFVYVTFFGSIVVFAEGGHIVINFLLERLPIKIRRVMEIIINIMVAAFLMLIIVGGKSTLEVNKVVTAASLRWFKMNYLYGGVLVAGIIMLIHIIINILKLVSEYEQETLQDKE